MLEKRSGVDRCGPATIRLNPPVLAVMRLYAIYSFAKKVTCRFESTVLAVIPCMIRVLVLIRLLIFASTLVATSPTTAR